MGIDIGKMAVQLTANSSGFSGALDKTSAAVQGWGNNITSTLSGAAGKVTSIVGGITRTLLGVTGIGAGLSLAGLFSGASDIIKQDQAAKELGLSLTDMRVAMKFAGPAADSMGGAITSLNQKLVAARLGSVAARQDFAGLAAVTGKSAASLQAGGQLGIIEAIAGISDPTLKAAQAFRFFEDNALPILDRLKEGGVAGARDFIKRMGLEVSTADVENMKQMAKTTGELRAVGAGVFNQALMGIAPVVAEIAKGFAGWKIDLSGMRALIQGLAEGMARFVGLIGQGAGDTKLIGLSFDYVWKQAERGWLNLEALILKGLARIADSFKDYLPAANAADVKALKQAGMGDARTAAAAQLKLDSYNAGQSAGLAGLQATDLFNKLSKSLARPPSSPAQDARDRFDPLVIKELTKQLDTMRSGLGNPLAAFAESVSKIGLTQQAGLFAGNDALRGRLGFKAGTDLLSAAGMGGISFAGAAEANTREAYSAIGRYEAEGRRGGLQEQIKSAVEAILKQQELQSQTGDAMLRATEEIKRSSGKAAELLAGGGGL